MIVGVRTDRRGGLRAAFRAGLEADLLCQTFRGASRVVTTGHYLLFRRIK